MRISTLVASVIVVSASLTGAANATVTLEFNPSWGSTENTGAAATAAFSFSDVASDVGIDLILKNITNGAQGGLNATAATLVGLAFDLPTFTSLTYADGGTNFTKLWTNVILPPFGTFDFGISTPRKTFVGGNPTGGLTSGNTLSVVHFKVNTTLTAAAFEAAFAAGNLAGGDLNAAARFQQVNAGGGSDKVWGGSPPPPLEPPTAVPESATWALMILGFSGVGAVIRTRRRLATPA